MKQSEAAAFWPLIKAWSEGKVLQMEASDGVWLDRDELKFDGHPSEYRIKPEPREFYIALSEYGPCGVSTINHGPSSFAPNFGVKDVIKVREVIE
jgi:hypothetical protein